MTEGAKSSPERFDVRTTADSHFSWLRTRMSLERTLMSWVRTGVSLIGFGFTIVQFFDRFSQMQGVAPAARPNAPRYFGLTLIAGGTLALMISAWQYREMIQYLWSQDFKPLAGVTTTKGHTPILAITLLLILTGICAFVAVILRLP